VARGRGLMAFCGGGIVLVLGLLSALFFFGIAGLEGDPEVRLIGVGCLGIAVIGLIVAVVGAATGDVCF
jgi:hypothetical protein